MARFLFGFATVVISGTESCFTAAPETQGVSIEQIQQRMGIE